MRVSNQPNGRADPAGAARSQPVRQAARLPSLLTPPGHRARKRPRNRPKIRPKNRPRRRREEREVEEAGNEKRGSSLSFLERYERHEALAGSLWSNNRRSSMLRTGERLSSPGLRSSSPCSAVALRARAKRPVGHTTWPASASIATELPCKWVVVSLAERTLPPSSRNLTGVAASSLAAAICTPRVSSGS